MKKWFTTAALTLTATAALAQGAQTLETIVSQTQWGTQWGNMVPIDMMNNGQMQVLTGAAHVWGNEAPFATVLMKDGDSWVEIAPFSTANDRPSYSVCDMNGDGIMDVVVSETLNTAETQGIFLGRGDCTFEHAEITIVDAEEGLPANFENPFSDFAFIQNSFVADFNNDALPDIVGIGNYENYVVLLNQGDMKFKPIYFDAGTEYDGKGHEPLQTCVAVADLNNDTYPDIVSSFWKRNVGNGQGHDRECFTEVYLNDGTGTHFTRTYLADTTVSSCNGGVALGDLNNDGFIDMVINGNGGLYAGTPYAIEETGNDYTAVWDQAHVCLNDGTGHFKLASKEDFDRPRVRPYNSGQNIISLFDWDGDGQLDIVFNGHTPEDGTNVWDAGYCTGYVYLNNQDGKPGKFARKYYYAGGSEGSCCLMDWDGDGKKDILATGYLRCDKFGDIISRSFSVSKNNEASTPAPAAPGNPKATVEANKVTLSWEASYGAPASTTYELYIKNAEGTLLGNCRAYIEGENEGLRKTEAFGNLGTNKTITYTLPDGSYEWGVQAVDGRRTGSKFAKGNFTIVANGIQERQMAETAQSVARYNVAGQQVSARMKGVQIEKLADGTIRKVVNK